MGATAVIIGDEDGDGLIRMGANAQTNTDSVVIPSVFISGVSFKQLRVIVEQSAASDNGTVLALLNAAGEVVFTEDSSQGVKMMAYLLLALPFLWCVAFGVYLIRKLCIDRRNRQLRTVRAADLPMVAYKKVDEEKQELRPATPTSPTPLHCRNDSCAICLDDFYEGQSVKVLPCAHGYHAECIDPWLNNRSDQCPVCKASILEGLQARRPWYSNCVRYMCCMRVPS